MSGRVIRVLELTKFDWGTVAASAVLTSAVVVRGIDVSASRETVVMVRVHAFTSQGTGGAINLNAYAEAPTSDDPSVIFIDATNLLLSAKTVPTSAGSLYAGPLAASPGGWMTLSLSVTQGNASGSPKGTFSIDVSLKD